MDETPFSTLGSGCTLGRGTGRTRTRRKAGAARLAMTCLASLPAVTVVRSCGGHARPMVRVSNPSMAGEHTQCRRGLSPSSTAGCPTPARSPIVSPPGASSSTGAGPVTETRCPRISPGTRQPSCSAGRRARTTTTIRASAPSSNGSKVHGAPERQAGARDLSRRPADRPGARRASRPPSRRPGRDRLLRSAPDRALPAVPCGPDDVLPVAPGDVRDPARCGASRRERPVSGSGVSIPEERVMESSSTPK